MVGLFGLKSKASTAIVTVPLILITIAYNEYCKIRFLPSFKHFSIQLIIGINLAWTVLEELPTNLNQPLLAWDRLNLREKGDGLV
ncbi:unnamed protein product [Eruca vesicaria subsp. sativa]|uniref:Uncharacterized protein n=1 Tax=Eruca vesicaria subsp. sativa TaxID=29727 RepID=A0ABC8LGK2_ERUVS|nr:unnamed protein product [Eruca vesicaria subsp. sativa]